jgi:uncharacterized membrane protein
MYKFNYLDNGGIVMAYKKVITSSLIVAIVLAFVNEFVFAATNTVTNDAVLDGALNILVMIQKYSWPFVTLCMIFALYKYYVTGSEVISEKVKGQQMVVGISIFMVVVQCLPLVYAFFIV